MLSNSFKFKIIFPTIIALVALVVVLNVFLSFRFSTLSEDLINEKLFADSNSLKRYLEHSGESARAAAVSTAFFPEAAEAVKGRDRNEIIRIFTDKHDLYGINHFIICDAEGIVLARTDDPASFGYSLSHLQSVKDAMSGTVSTYFESGSVSRVSVRAGAPVYDEDGSLIGVILAGVRFDSEDVIGELKELFGSEVSVFLGSERIATTISYEGRGIAGMSMHPETAEIVIENKLEYFGYLEVFDNNYKAFYLPLMDAGGEVFAAFSLGIPVAELTIASRRSIRNGIILGLSGLAASAALLFFIVSKISKPIVDLASDMDKIAGGILDIPINVMGNDEIGQLGKSLRKVVNILHRLHVDINVMIYEHERGNTDYYLNTDYFHGDYKVLADNILELAQLGMRDQLTGIANRRSFDNRLNLEWGRAIREEEPLSILMLDVDNFKNYNDTYGHQQGDAALQTIANVLRRSVKRSLDFAARWGGEEFVILLPGTDSAGALIVAENVRKEIENEPIPCSDSGAAKVTVSVGVSTKIPTRYSRIEHIISMADHALYSAKETGRNRVVFRGADDGA